MPVTPVGYTTVFGSFFQGADQHVIPNATIYFRPVDNKGNPISCRLNNSTGLGGQVSIKTVQAVVANGIFSIIVPDTTMTIPANIGYRVNCIDNLTGNELLGPGYECIQPTGDSWSFDLFTPNTLAQAPMTIVDGLSPKGTYDPTHTYGMGDVVRFSGATYASMIPANTHALTAGENDGFWTLLVTDGAVGATGSMGATGATGADGTNGAFFVTLDHNFTAAGFFDFVHNTNALYPVMECFCLSGSSAYTATPISDSTMRVTVAAPAHLKCSFVGSSSSGSSGGGGITGDFSFTVTPTTATYVPTLAPSQSVPFVIAQAISGTYSAITTYSLVGEPSGMTANAPTVSGSSSSTLTASFPWNQAPGDVSLTVSGTGGGLTHTNPIDIVIAPVNTSLVQGWQMGEGTGLTFADAQGTNTLTATTALTRGTVAGLTGSVPIFPGTVGVYAAAANHATTDFGLSSAFSISLWFTFSASVTFNALLQANASDDSKGWLLIGDASSGFRKLLFEIKSTGGTIILDFGGVPANNTLYHAMICCDGGGVASSYRGYLNGVSAGGSTGTLGGASPASGANLHVGADYLGTSPHAGIISRLRIYNQDVGSQAAAIFAGGV